MAIPSVTATTPYGGHAVRLLGTTPSPCSAPHYASVQHGHRPANPITLHACSTSMPSGHRPFHVHPLLLMGVRGRTEVRNLKRQWSAYCFSSSGCAVEVVGGHSSARLVPFAAGLCQGAACYRVWGEGRTCFQAAAGTIQEAVADGPALHSRVHLVVRGLEFWFR